MTELDSKQRRARALYEIRDLLAGAAFPFMLQLVFSASIILFADYSEDAAVAIVALVFGEALLVGAYIIFGRQNGLTAYRRTVQGEKKRAIDPSDIKARYRTGEYALWKGFVIGAISIVPFILVQFIECLYHNSVTSFLLLYAFGWAAYPFRLIGEIPSVGALSPWLNFVMIVFPVGIHALAYELGKRGEKKRQDKAAATRDLKDKRR